MTCCRHSLGGHGNTCHPTPFTLVFTLTGCTNSNYGGMLGQSRIFVTMSRAGLLPKVLVSQGEGGRGRGAG